MLNQEQLEKEALEIITGRAAQLARDMQDVESATKQSVAEFNKTSTQLQAHLEEFSVEGETAFGSIAFTTSSLQ